jgi:hypothetical protein
MRWEDHVARMAEKRNATFSFKQLLNCTHKTEWTLFKTHYFSENLVAPGIEPQDLWICSQELLNTRPQRRSTFFYITYIHSVRTSQETQYISVL